MGLIADGVNGKHDSSCDGSPLVASLPPVFVSLDREALRSHETKHRRPERHAMTRTTERARCKVYTTSRAVIGG